MKKFLALAAALLMLPAVTFAVQITVPSASTAGQVLISNANGTYSAGTAVSTSTIGSLNGTIVLNGFPYLQSGAGLVKALAAINGSSGGVIDLPCGVYLFTARVNVTNKNNLTIQGHGKGC